MRVFKKSVSLLALCVMSFSIFSTVSAETNRTVPSPNVVGPLESAPIGDLSRDYVFGATDVDLDSNGYIEEEFFIEGVAREFVMPSLRTGAIKEGSTPYKTRIVVRRPAEEKDFNGTVLLEWYNVTSSLDLEFDWLLSHDYIVREGYAWVGVSAQPVGVNYLKGWSSRYQTLNVTHNDFSYDIYSQVARAIREPEAVNVLGALTPELIVATGHSQSARYLANYYNSIHPLHELIDGYVIRGSATPVRKDLDVKMIRTMAEGDVRQYSSTDAAHNGDEEETDYFRRWEVAGTSHVDLKQREAYVSTLTRDIGGVTPVEAVRPPFSHIPFHHVQNAAYEHMVNWIKTGQAPPIAPRLEWVSNTVKARDEFGNALGGIRLPEHEVPTAVNTGDNTGPGFEFLFGSHEPFDEATLKKLYRNHGAYVSAINRATNVALKQGFILQKDAQITREKAAQSQVGK